MEAGDTEMKRKRTEKEKAFLRAVIKKETRAMMSILEDIKNKKRQSYYHFHYCEQSRLQRLVDFGCLKYHPSSKYVFQGTFTFIHDFDESFFVQP